MVNVFYSRLDPSVSIEWEKDHYNLLPQSMQHRAEKYNNKHDRDLSIIGKLLVLESFKSFNIDYSLNDVKIDQFKRPFINLDFDFNISHSKGIVVCVASNNARVGIDVEIIEDMDISCFIDFFNKNDWTKISLDRSLGLFYKSWTTLEAILKAHGQGFLGPKYVFGSSIFQHIISYLNRNWKIHEITLDPSYCCHIAIDQLEENQICLHEVKF
ncbi:MULTISPECIES: 4'-phosphopantetheinyl transferase family protein [Sphingobacterium]|uniref:4'-phosphopantetheinyl transferase family protein n=1 Tax=Sphingobacterium TaxID=28453 RepID=UPI000B49123A|nr:hypothetical protein [Flavobacteriaceae bacterium]